MTSYEEIAADLREDIQTGRLAVGERAPSTRELRDQHGVSLQTAHRAIEQLRREGYVETRPRSGTFVLSQQPEPLSKQVADLRERMTELERRLGAIEDCDGSY